MYRTQNQGVKRDRNAPRTIQNTSIVEGKEYKTIWKAKKSHDDVIDTSITGNIKY
jgi:hypothetical protein